MGEGGVWCVVAPVYLGPRTGGACVVGIEYEMVRVAACGSEAGSERGVEMSTNAMIAPSSAPPACASRRRITVAPRRAACAAATLATSSREGARFAARFAHPEALRQLQLAARHGVHIMRRAAARDEGTAWPNDATTRTTMRWKRKTRSLFPKRDISKFGKEARIAFARRGASKKGNSSVIPKKRNLSECQSRIQK